MNDKPNQFPMDIDYDTGSDTESDTESESDELPYRRNYIGRKNHHLIYPHVDIQQIMIPVGFIQDSEDPTKLQQLYGRQTYPNSNQWNYFIKSDQYHQIPIPIEINGGLVQMNEVVKKFKPMILFNY